MRKITALIILVFLAASCGEQGSGKKGAGSADNRERAAGVSAESGPETEAPPEKSAASTRRRAGKDSPAATDPGANRELPEGAVLIATDIVTEVIISPDPEGDPWEIEKVAGYQGNIMVDGIFGQIYDGTLKVFDYHSGKPLSPADVKKIEGEFKNDRTKIGKLLFTEDWYYFPEENSVRKRVKSVTFGYELYNNVGKVYAYRAAFRADLQ